jgi:hypothetical protein
LAAILGIGLPNGVERFRGLALARIKLKPTIDCECTAWSLDLSSASAVAASTYLGEVSNWRVADVYHSVS